MKKNYEKILRQLLLRLGLLALTVIISVLAWFALNLPYQDVFLYFYGNDFFWYDGKRVALLSIVPFFIYMIFVVLIAVFSKTHRQPRALDNFSVALAISSISCLVFMNVLSLFFYLYIAVFTPYKPCEDPKLKHYFVTDYAICKTIVNNEFN